MTDTSLTIQEPPTALTITAPTADGLKALKKYARSGSAFYGQLLKCSGKDGTFTAGQQGIEVAPGTELAAILPALLGGFILWRDGQIVDQVLEPVGPDFDPKALRATLSHADESQWQADDRGRPVDPWREQAQLPMRSLTDGAEYTFSTSSDGGVKAVKRLVGVWANHVAAQLETNGCPIPVVAIGSGWYPHPQKERGEIFFPTFEPSYWVDLRAVLALQKPAEEQKKFEDYRSEKMKKRRNRKVAL
jgi:hypothetical protein